MDLGALASCSGSTLNGQDKQIRRRCALGLYIAALAPRLLAIICPPTVFYYNFDERDIVYSALDRFFGIPSVSIMEPATIVHLLSLPLYGLDMLIRLGVPHHAAEFLDKTAVYLSVATRDPRHVITITRLLVAVLCSFAPVVTYQIACRFRTSTTIAIACGLVVAFHPMFFFQSVMAAGDSVAAMLVLLCVSLLLTKRFSETGRILCAGAIFAAAVAAKITAASAIVLPLLILGWEPFVSLSRRIRLITFFGISALAAFFAFMPFVWTDPVRFAKAVFGTVNKSGSAFGLSAFWRLLVDAHGIVLVFGIIVTLLIAIPIIVARWQQFGRYIAAAAVTLVVMTLPVALHATTAHSRYLVPTLPAIAVLFAATGAAIAARPGLNYITVAFLTVILIATGSKEIRVQMDARRPDDLVDALRATSSLPAAAKILIPVSAFEMDIVEMPRSFWIRMWQRADKMEHGEGVRSFIQQHGISSRVADVLITDFNEDEQSHERHAAAAAMTAPDLRCDMFVYADGETPIAARQPQIDMSAEEAISSARSAENATAILLRQEEPSLGVPVWHGRIEWFWYVRFAPRVSLSKTR